MFKNTIVVSVCVNILCCFHGDVKGQDKQEKKIEQLPIRLLIEDPDGNPIEGATVYPWALRDVERKAHVLWSPASHGEAKKVVSDNEGIANCRYPRNVDEKRETGEVSWTVEHPDFLRTQKHCNVNEDPARIAMERGFRIAATAIDSRTQQPIKEDIYGSTSSGGHGPWDLKSNGMLVSTPIADQPTIVRIYRIVEDEPILFSDRIDVKPDGRSRVLLTNVELKPGIRVEGKLDDAIERPIKNGVVISSITTQPDVEEGVYARWDWTETVPIAEDGTFVFESLPQGETLQMIPVCDGYVSARLTADEIRPFFPEEVRLAGITNFRIPQCVHLDHDVKDVILKMEVCAHCRVKVVDHDDNPLAGISVSMSPNQYWFQGGSQLLGAGREITSLVRADYLRRRKAGEDVDSEVRVSFPENSFRAITDEQGIATISGLPGDTTEKLWAGHETWELPDKDDFGAISVDLKPGETKEVTIKMQRKETEVRGEKNNE